MAKRLNEYEVEQLEALAVFIDVTKLTAREAHVEPKFHRQITFWKGEVKTAINDAQFEKERLKY